MEAIAILSYSVVYFFFSLLPALSFHKARLFSAICARGRGTDGENKKKGGKRQHTKTALKLTAISCAS